MHVPIIVTIPIPIRHVPTPQDSLGGGGAENVEGDPSPLNQYSCACEVFRFSF